MSNIIEFLKSDHAKIKQTMTQLAKLHGGDKDLYDQYFTQFKTEFKEHTEIEEKVLYPALKGHSDLDELARKGFAAHHSIKIGIIELRLVPFQSENWPAKFAVNQDSILSHIEEEETLLFPKISKALSAETLEELGRKAVEFRNNPALISMGI